MEESLLASLCPPAIDPNSPRAKGMSSSSFATGFSTSASSSATSTRPRTPKRKSSQTQVISSARTRGGTSWSSPHGHGRARASSSDSWSTMNGTTGGAMNGISVSGTDTRSKSSTCSTGALCGRKRKASVSSTTSRDSTRSFFDSDESKPLHPDLVNALRTLDAHRFSQNTNCESTSASGALSGNVMSSSSQSQMESHPAKRLRVSQTFDTQPRDVASATADRFGSASLSRSQHQSLTVTPPPLPNPHSLSKNYQAAAQNGTNHMSPSTPRTQAVPVLRSRSGSGHYASHGIDSLFSAPGVGQGTYGFHADTLVSALSGDIPTNLTAGSTTVALPPPMLSGLPRSNVPPYSPKHLSNGLHRTQSHGTTTTSGGASMPPQSPAATHTSTMPRAGMVDMSSSRANPFSHTFNQTMNAQFDGTNRRRHMDAGGHAHAMRAGAAAAAPPFSGFPPLMSFLAQ